jgi:uncharacterized repeat protein (TIGR03803 family)
MGTNFFQKLCSGYSFPLKSLGGIYLKKALVGLIVFVGVFLGFTLSASAQINILHEFQSDSSFPHGSLIAWDGVLYGMTTGGVAGDCGTVFKINPDGSGFVVIHYFSEGAGDGNNPYGSLFVSGGVLYGMTLYGGANNNGTIFKINPDGSGYALLHSFSEGAGDGKYPHGSLIASGGALFGMTSGGGASDIGTIFKINPDGSGFALLHSFAGGAGDGQAPYGSLIDFGGALYGMTSGGGARCSAISGGNYGTIFKINPDGSGFALLHSFQRFDGAYTYCNEGSHPQGSLIEFGGMLYGMAVDGSSNSFNNYNPGLIFKINPDGSGYIWLYEFRAWRSEPGQQGGHPYGSLIASGEGTLYGMASEGGASDKGTVFKINFDGSGFSLLHSFAGGAGDGKYPYGSLINIGETLYGMTSHGGSTDLGVIFSLPSGLSGPTISGTVKMGGSPLPDVVMDGLPGNPVTNASGQYTAIVSSGWSGTVTPTKSGCVFSPPWRSYTNVLVHQLNQDYSSPVVILSISGTVQDGETPLPDVVMNGLPGNPVTNASGQYTGTVNYGWTGTVTPSKLGYTFSPPSRSYSDVTVNQVNQDYLRGAAIRTISGAVYVDENPLPDVVMNGLPGNPVTNASGQYTGTVNYGWTGTVTPYKAGYTFTPPSRSYSNVTVNQVNQDYSYSINGSLGFQSAGSWTGAGKAIASWFIGDFNGDGKKDIFRYYPGVSGADMFLSDGTQFNSVGSWTGAGYGSDGWYVGDFNGDGKDDIFRYYPGVSGADMFLSDGTQFNSVGSWTGAGNGSDGWYVGDFNGDGKADIFRYYPGVSGADMFLSDGTQFVSVGSWTGAGYGSDGWYVGDFNGDGKDDIFRYLPGISGADMFLSDGTQFVSVGSWTGAGNGSDGWYIGDFNGDGKDDIMRYIPGVGSEVFLSDGTQFVSAGIWTGAGNGTDGWYVGDFNGDGMDDIFRYYPGVSGADMFLAGSVSGSVSEFDAFQRNASSSVGILLDAAYWMEEKWLEPFRQKAARGELVSLMDLKQAYENATGEKPTRAVLLRWLKRHDFRLISKE